MSKPKWRNYTPTLDVFSGGATTPNLGDAARTQTGRYLYLPELNLVFAQFIIGFGNSASGGSGTYIVSLPHPAQIALGGISSGGYGLDQHDRPIGSAYIGRLFQGHGITVYPSIADSGPNSTAGLGREKWVQFFSPWQRDTGTSSITSGNTTKAITFAQTFVTAPSAADITINFTNNPTNLQTGFPWITSITTTGFTLNVITAPGTGGLNFSWSVRQETPVFVTDQSPWPWGTLGDGIYGSCYYEPAAY